MYCKTDVNFCVVDHANDSLERARNLKVRLGRGIASGAGAQEFMFSVFAFWRFACLSAESLANHN